MREVRPRDIILYVVSAMFTAFTSIFIGMGLSYIAFQWARPNEFLMGMSVIGGILLSAGLLGIATGIFIYHR